ncbi:hypothetical protein TNCV_5038331 [Trichonephila clavipes]|nr:hypothetical protein TNCV_5038331 [Trichonephila clavipes]
MLTRSSRSILEQCSPTSGMLTGTGLWIKQYQAVQDFLLGKNRIRKTPAMLDYPIALSEELIALDNDNVCAAPVMSAKTFRSLFKAQKISLIQIPTMKME